VGKRFTTSLCALALSILAAGCAGGDNHNAGNSNAANSNMTSSATNSSPTTGAADGEIVTTEVNGVKTQTRTFRNNARVQRVVVTTDASGKRTARVYSSTGDARELPESKIDQALTATGDAVADAAGVVADKAEDVGRPVADKAEDIGRGAADKAEDAAGVVADKAEDVGRGAAKGAKKAGEKTVEGAKKVGGAIKDAVPKP
jgi:hypothetical protein